MRIAPDVDWKVIASRTPGMVGAVLANIVNEGSTDLKLYTVYAPPQHAPGTVHKTKAEADAAEGHD